MGSTVGAGLRALVSTPGRIALVLVTVLVGALAAFGFALDAPGEQLTFARIAPLTQLIMSVLTPLSTVLLTSDLRAPATQPGFERAATLPSRWIAAGIYGVAMGAYGVLVVALATRIAAGAGPVADPWVGAAPTILGSLVVQLIPVGVGCAAGLLIARTRRAQLATIVVPFAASFVLARLAPAGTTDWVTPLAAADHLLPGPMTALTWAQWVVTAAVWVVLPNWLGARWLRRRAAVRP